MNQALFLALALAPQAATVSNGSASASVRLRVAGERTPLPGLRVMVIPDASTHRPGRPLPLKQHVASDASPRWVRSATTDEAGEATFDGLEVQRVRIVVVAPGYERLEQILELPQTRPASLFLRPDPETAYRTVVAPPPPAPPRERVDSRIITPEEIETLPGSQGDALRALQNLPGVARTPGGLGLLVLRGAAPNQSRIFYGEHAIPIGFHAVAFASVVPAEATEGIEFIPSNGPVRYGGMTGGVVAIEPAHPSADGWHGYAELDVGGTGALVRGPVGRGAFLAAVNRGWLDWVLGGAQRVLDDGGTYTLPRYFDYQALYERPLRRGATIGTRVLGSRDRVVFRDRNRETQELHPQLSIQTEFHRADLVYRKRQGPWTFLLSPSFRYESTSTGGDPDARRDDYVVSWRAEASRRLSARLSLLAGVDGEVDPYRTRVTLPPSALLDRPIELTTRGQGVQTSFGLYSVAEARLGDVTLWPGVRLNAFSLGADAELAVDPRFTGRWAMNDRWWLAFGAGLYSQAFIPQVPTVRSLISDAIQTGGNVVLPAAISALEPRAGFNPIGDRVGVSRAGQVSTSFGFAPSPAWSFEAGAYGRLLHNGDVAYPTEEQRALTPVGYDAAYGLEVFLRKRAVGRWYGWLAYTLSRAETRLEDAYQSEADTAPGLFDQRHILTLVASYQLPRRWRIGGRFRLVSGSPYTPVTGAIDLVRNGGRAPIYGPSSSARFPSFHQLDLRIDKQWLYRHFSVTTYLDVQNVYNQPNVEALIYDTNFVSAYGSVGLPILPILGVRIDF